MSDDGSAPSPAARGIAGQVVANTSLLVAVLVYMGWGYDDALYGYFHLSPLDLDFEYQGFRLLLDRAGTYYLLPAGWSPRLDITYVLSDTDPIRVELVSGTVRSG